MASDRSHARTPCRPQPDGAVSTPAPFGPEPAPPTPFHPIRIGRRAHSPAAGFQLAGDPAIERRPADGRLWDYAADHLGFYEYLRVSNTRILRRVGVGLLDLPDRRWRDDYNNRLHPGKAADQAITDAAAEMGCAL